MNRKLISLDVLLLAVVVFAGVRLHEEWVAGKARREALSRSSLVKPAPAPPFQKSPEPPAVMATSYAKIAQELLLDPSRNPDIPIPPKPEPQPPPPPPPPPVFHGMMNIGAGPQIIMSEKANTARQWLSPGDKIGEYKLVSFNSEAVELEWNGQRFIKQLSEISGHGAGPQPGGEQAGNQASAPAPAPVQQVSLGPGAPGANGDRGCQNNDSDPFGTVKDGYIKTEVRNPLFPNSGGGCVWKPVGH